MALKLLRKEWTLCLHPAALIMLGLSTLTLIPNYPYTVSFFYTTLGLFFISINKSIGFFEQIHIPHSKPKALWSII